jgi:hypothetical protein
MRFTSQTGRRHDGTLDQLASSPAHLIQVGGSVICDIELRICVGVGGIRRGFGEVHRRRRVPVESVGRYPSGTSQQVESTSVFVHIPRLRKLGLGRTAAQPAAPRFVVLRGCPRYFADAPRQRVPRRH